MFWTRLLKLRRWTRSAAATGALDRKLIRNIRRRLIPTAAQFKYVFRFLTPTEKKVVQGALAVIIVAGLSLAGIFTARRIALAPKAGGEYIEAMVGEPKMINPLFAGVNDVDADLSSLIYSGLFRYNAEQQLTPDLAVDYTVSADKKTYEISLRRDVSWSDGEPFTAEDVLFTLESIQNPEIGSPLYPAFQGVTVEKINNYAVRFVLKTAFAPFLEGLTVGILPEHIWTHVAPANIKLAKNNLQPIGSGPWKFEKLTKDEAGAIQSYSLKRNEKYYGQQAYLQTLTFRFCADYEQASDLLRGREAAAVSFVPRQIKEKFPQKSLNLYTLRLPQYTTMFFNQSREPLLKDSDARLALARAIDKERLISEALGGEGEVTDAPIPRGILGYHPAPPRIAYDTGEANKLLDKNWPAVNPEDFFKIKRDELFKARAKEIDELKKATSTPETAAALAALEDNLTAAVRRQMDPSQLFYRKNKEGKFLSLTITTVDAPEYIKIADFIGALWKKIGVHASVQAKKR